MGQGFSTTTLSSGSAGIDVRELSDLTYEKSLGSARFIKTIRARHRHGLVVIKAVAKPSPALDLGQYVKAIRQERDALADVANVLSYQRVLETGTNGYLVRQFLYSSLYDRMSTRPFLEDIEKKWLAFQLLCALRDCHARDIFHGDIKTENVLVTSWNWLYLTDFSSCFKKTYLPEDNPADFSYYFDTSGRRTCYLAPERFLGPSEKDDGKGVNWAMDVFSAGCVIAELFLEAPIFSLSQLYKYRKSEYDPKIGYLSKIQDPEIRALVTHMIQLEPESRYSVEEYLDFWRRKAFPEYFYSFLHQYMGLITDPASGRAPVLPETTSFGDADDRIDRVFYDFDKISYFLGYEHEDSPQAADTSFEVAPTGVIPVQIDIPNNRHQASTVGRRPGDDGSLIFLTLVVSSLRNTARATARVRACDLMLAFAERITDEAKLDRVLPYVATLLNDRADIVKIAAVRSMTQLLALITVVSPVNAHVFTEYVRPRLQHLVQGPGPKAKPVVRATYASCLATLAHTSSMILDMVQALRADGSIPTIDPEAEDSVATNSAYQNLFDVAQHDLAEHFELHTKALLEDRDILVRRSFLGSVSSLCVFFGSSKANDVVLSHLNTYLNDKDWMLRCAFFQTIVGVATFVGGPSLEEFILPLMVQALTDPEESVVEKVLSSFASMAELGLFQRSKTWEMVDVVGRFMMHPNMWIREAAVHYIAAATRYLSAADTHCIILPLIQPYLKASTMDFTETNILDALKKPLSRTVLDMAAIWATKVERGIFWKPIQQQKTFSFGSSEQTLPIISSKDLGTNGFGRLPKNEEDEQWITRLRNLGMGMEDDFKLLALREYTWRMARIRPREAISAPPSRLNDVLKLKELDITPQTIFFETKRKQAKVQRKLSHDGSQASSFKEKPQTIADAFLDASTTMDDSVTQRKKSHVNSRKERINEIESLLPLPSDSPRSRQESSALPVTSSSSPSHNHTPRDYSASPSDGEARRPSPLLSRMNTDGTIGAEDSMTHRNTLRTGHQSERVNGVRHKSSAINLLNRRDTSKTVAETSTTSATAVGTVDGPFSRDEYPNPSSALPDHAEQRQVPPVQRHGGHTYDGNDPNVMKLLDSLANEHYPADVVDFGPLVAPVKRQRVQRGVDAPESEAPWRPEGTLVATFGEHTGPINRVQPSPDHIFFVTASDDGTVKIWDTSRLGRNLAHRSRQTHKHADGSRVKCITFVENTHTFVSCATDGSVHVVKVDCISSGDTTKYGKLRLLRQYQLLDGEYAVWSAHFKAETNSVLLLATNASRIVALDLRTMTVLYIFDNPVHHGTPTCFCIDKKHNWLLLGTSHGVLDLWDLRFRIRLKAWGLAGGTPIHRLHIHPLKGRGRWVCVAGGTGQNDITVWDIVDTQCHEVYRAGSSHGNSKDSLKLYEAWKVDEEKPEGMLGRFATSLEPSGGGSVDRGVRALAVGIDAPDDGRESKYGFFLAGGSDRKVRFWDLARIEASMVVSGLDLEEGKPTFLASQPTPKLTVNTERLPQSGPTAPNAGPNIKAQSNNVVKKGSGRPPRSTVISQQQQRLLKSHLDSILDVALLEYPCGMTVSVDRAGVIYVFQ